jgi:uncharacterized membrane protein YqaE (UPF0057 family)
VAVVVFLLPPLQVALGAGTFARRLQGQAVEYFLAR